MIDIARREPHDEKAPEEVIELVIHEWFAGGCPDTLPASIIEALVYKAYFECNEGALRWLDPTDVLKRIGI